MSQKIVFKRYLLEIQKLTKSGPSSFEEIYTFLLNQSEIFGEDFTISNRTFSRDIKEINFIFDIEISFDFSSKKYILERESISKNTYKLIDTFYILDALNMKDRIDSNIHLDDFKTSGTEFLHVILKAIRNRKIIQFTYQKFDDPDHLSHRKVEPYGVKEYRNWWFLLGKDLKDYKLKQFGLDRIQSIELTNLPFVIDPHFDINQYFKYSFGTTVPEHKKPEEIIIQVNGEEINYIKAKPLHNSQKILKVDNDIIIISIYVYITWELITELRGKGDYIKVLAPVHLKKNLFKYRYHDLF